MLAPFRTPFSTLVETLSVDYYFVVPVGFDPSRPVGTGPFKYESFTPGQQSVFVRNENYWQSGLPYVDRLIMTDYASETSQINALLSGVEDVVDLLSATSISAVTSGGAHVSIEDGGGMTPFTMRVDKPPFTDPRVREAFRLIPNRAEMIRLVFEGRGHIGNDVFSYGIRTTTTIFPNVNRILKRRSSC